VILNAVLFCSTLLTIHSIDDIALPESPNVTALTLLTSTIFCSYHEPSTFYLHQDSITAVMPRKKAASPSPAAEKAVKRARNAQITKRRKELLKASTFPHRFQFLVVKKGYARRMKS